MTTGPSVIFMGTPAFALPALQALIDSNYNVLGVYTQPPRPAGRGQKLKPSPVQMLAEHHNLPVFNPIHFKRAEDTETFQSHKADIAVVAAYGLLLPASILNGTRYGCINIHPSKLPRWRGAAPIQRTLMAGDTETACCIMKMDEGLDTGDILLQKNIPIPVGINAGDLHNRLAGIGAAMTLEALAALRSSSWNPQPQSNEGVTYARKITKEECHIDWQRPAQEILWKVLGLSHSPGAYTLLEEAPLKILAAEISDNQTNAAPGTIVNANFTIATAHGTLRPLNVQKAGKKPMSVDEMLRGQPAIVGSVLR